MSCRYLKGYLSLNSQDYRYMYMYVFITIVAIFFFISRAHKWMGRLYMDTDDFTRAIIHYKM